MTPTGRKDLTDRAERPAKPTNSAEILSNDSQYLIAQMPMASLPCQIRFLEASIWHHLTENFFCKLKEFKRIAMRADKTDQSFDAIIHLAAAVITQDEYQQALE